MLKLITDRTTNDIARAKKLIEKAKKIESLTESELDEYYNGLRGCYNISDLNRVEDAVQYISDLLNSISYRNKVYTKQFDVGFFFIPEEEVKYLENIRILRESIPLFQNTPQVPSTYKGINNANAIEKVLSDIVLLMSYLSTNKIYCGVSRLGQSRLWQKRFRIIPRWISLDIEMIVDSDVVWNALMNNSNSLTDFPTDINSPISGSLNLWNYYCSNLDELVGDIYGNS